MASGLWALIPLPFLLLQKGAPLFFVKGMMQELQTLLTAASYFSELGHVAT